MLHYQKGLAGGLTDVVDGADVRMIQARSGLRLALKTFAADWIVGTVTAQQLDCHRSLETGVRGAEHFSPAAFTQTVIEAVRSEHPAPAGYLRARRVVVHSSEEKRITAGSRRALPSAVLP